MKFSFLDYTNEIFAVSAKSNDPDINFGMKKFQADVEAGKALSYNTGDILPDFDFASAKEEWDKLTDGEKEDAYTEWHEFIEAKYDEICAAFAEGTDAVQQVVDAWRLA